MEHGFCFTSAYLVVKYFTRWHIGHHEFKCAAILALKIFKRSASLHEARSINVSWESVFHTLEKPGFSKECLQKHGYKKSRKVKNTRPFRCKICGVPFCKTSQNECWYLHIWMSLQKNSLRTVSWLIHHRCRLCHTTPIKAFR